MKTITLKEIINALEPLTKEVQPDFVYRINSKPSTEKENDKRLADTVDEVYCEGCVREEIEWMKSFDPDGEYQMAGGPDYRARSDGFGFCYKCSCFLWVALTTEGARSKLQQYQSVECEILHLDSEFAYKFVLICRAIERATNEEKATLTEQAVALYHRYHQMQEHTH